MALWGGRFEGEPDELFKRFNDSLRFDYRLLIHDLRGSAAWTDALLEAGVVTEAEQMSLVGALKAIAKESGAAPEAIASDLDEDIHSWVERELINRVGELGKKLHTGRSRNDQVATDLRLYISAELSARIGEARRVQGALVDLAERSSGAVLPGYTHLQRAQPVLFAHWCLAYFEMLERDIERLSHAATQAMARCPLGSAALAGTAYRIDREALAHGLGFAAASRNSLDSISDRDFVLDALHALSACALHLTRFAEDLILYCSGEFGFVKLGDSVTSGSSLMPQKKNPDALELIRAKSGRVLGAYTALGVALKGLPLAYNKDLQEDKEGLFDAMETLSFCLSTSALVIQSIEIDAEQMLRAAQGGYSNATDLADYLVSKGVPFREAHEIVGVVVRHAIERGVPLEALDVDSFRDFSTAFEADVLDWLSIDTLLAKRDVLGGTAPGRVAEAVRSARVTLEKAAAN